MAENTFIGLKNRFLQHLARFGPGATSLRIMLHKLRGVKIGKNVFIGYDTIIETACPYWVSIGNNVEINMGTKIMAHFRNISTNAKEKNSDFASVIIEDDVFIGIGVIILPNVKIGRGSVITAGSVVTKNIPPMTLVQGNPAQFIATCGVPLTGPVSYNTFLKKLKPYKINRDNRN